MGIMLVMTGSGTITNLLKYLKQFIQLPFSKSNAQDLKEARKLSADDMNMSKEESEKSGRKPDAATCTQVSTRTRKLFHLLAVAIFVPGAMKEPLMTSVAATCCLVVFIIMEV